MKFNLKSYRIQPQLKPLPQVKNILAVASGKGGVGKSTVAVNLAIALQQQGLRVGLLDADIYGPSQPKMLGVTGQKPTVTEDKKWMPVMAHQLQTMSIGFLIDQDQPAVWRGPMVSKALEQLVFDTAWDNLDLLLVDMPPGTGDIQLTLAQKIPLAGALMVTTPQDIALIDVKKAIVMFEKVGVKSLGIIENMSVHTCEQCGHQSDIFGEQGAEKLSENYEVPLLGKLPLASVIREGADQGRPIVLSTQEKSIAQTYVQIAIESLKYLAQQPIEGKAEKFEQLMQQQKRKS